VNSKSATDAVVEAVKYAGVTTLGDFHGSLDAGVDGFVVSEGVIDATSAGGLYAARDLQVYAVGDVVGFYDAGRDGSVITYGTFQDAVLTATRDVGRNHFDYYGIPGVWANEGISGLITAGRNVGHWDEHFDYVYSEDWDYDIFTHGGIDAIITAKTPGELSGRGGLRTTSGIIDIPTSPPPEHHSLLSITPPMSDPPSGTAKMTPIGSQVGGNLHALT